MEQQGGAVARRGVVVALLLVLFATLLSAHLAGRARGADVDRCEQFAAASLARSQAVTGSGDRVLVIGDSWSAGLGLARPEESWPARLPGRVQVAGFSGSGFARDASSCGPEVAFASRAARAVRSAGPVDLVVVEGGLNDYDQSDAAIRAGFDALLVALRGHQVVVVGPASAPSRAGAVPRVDALLADLAAEHDVAYVPASGWTLDYLGDDLHLTPEGHRAFGDAVARALPDPTSAWE